MTGLRNGLAALAAVLLLLVLGHALAPALAPYLPGATSVAAVLGLLGCLATLFYKLLDSALAALRVGRRGAPVSSRWVSVLAGGSAIALVSAAFVVVTTALIEQAIPLLRASPGTAATVASPLAHLDLWRLVAELFIALMVGAWIGRRHGRWSLGVVAACVLLGWAAMLTIDILAGLRTAASVQAALHDAVQTPSLATAKASGLPLLLGLLVAAVFGAWLGGGGRSSRQGQPPLMLGA